MSRLLRSADWVLLGLIIAPGGSQLVELGTQAAGAEALLLFSPCEWFPNVVLRCCYLPAPRAGAGWVLWGVWRRSSYPVGLMSHQWLILPQRRGSDFPPWL